MKAVLRTALIFAVMLAVIYAAFTWFPWEWALGLLLAPTIMFVWIAALGARMREAEEREAPAVTIMEGVGEKAGTQTIDGMKITSSKGSVTVRQGDVRGQANEMSTGGWDVTLSEGDPAKPETLVSNIGTYPDALEATQAAMESVADEIHKAHDDIEFLLERYGGELVEKLPLEDGTRVCGIAECDNPIGEGRTSLCDECTPLRTRAMNIIGTRRSREKLRELRDTSANVVNQKG